MRVVTEVYIAFGLGITLGATVSTSASAQVPTVESKPRAAVPVREGVIQAAVPTDTAPPPAQPSSPPTAAPAAAATTEPAPVSAAPPPSGVTQLGPTAAPTATGSSSAAAMKAGYFTARYSLSVDGIDAGFLQAVEGGAAVGTVVVENLGPDNIQKKHIAGVKYEDLSFDVGMDSKPVIAWITQTWQGKSSRKDGNVQLMDQNYNVVSERQFKNALLAGTTVPALEQNGKRALALTVTVAPESVREVAGSGKASPSAAKGRAWMSSNFRFEMGDLETAYVTRIDSFTVRQPVTENDAGQARQPEKLPNALEFPNLKIRMGNRPSPNWAKWREQFLTDGNGREAQEKNGAIVFLDPSRKNELGRINLFNCGLVRLGADRLEAGRENASTVTAELYCEKMELAINS